MKTIQFGVLVQDGDLLRPHLVPVDRKVQAHLEYMFQESEPKQLGRTPEPFQLAEKYSDSQCATLPLDDCLASQVKELYDAQNIGGNASVLDDPARIKAYFGIVEDSGRVLGLRQATQFKTLHHKPLAVFSDGQLGMQEKPLFKLDERWDLVTDGKTLTILSATAFERICDLSPQIRQSAVAGLTDLAPQMPYLDMNPLQDRVLNFTRSARVVADLRKRGDLATVQITKLQSESDRQRIEYEVVNGMYIVKKGSEEGLLMLLDRRRYADPLAEVDPDIYEADSRHKVPKS
ncbi:MAG: hypothetical protein AKCLJLPJ_02013 [Fimbriimonadales bacterium]|nr:hypothetical protein [Fimbriimonadales bacterium]